MRTTYIQAVHRAKVALLQASIENGASEAHLMAISVFLRSPDARCLSKPSVNELRMLAHLPKPLWEHPIKLRENHRMRTMVRSRIRDDTPLQYLIGEWPFCAELFRLYDANQPGIFACRKPALIPRPRTESLVRSILEYYVENVPRHQNGIEFEIVDVGSGTGCIAITLTKLLPKVLANATGMSEYNFSSRSIAIEPNAIAAATTSLNAYQFGVLKNLSLLPKALNDETLYEIHGDIEVQLQLSRNKSSVLPISRSKRAPPCRIYVSNPPYIPSDVMGTLPRHISAHEGVDALCGGKDGLDVARSVLLLFALCQSNSDADDALPPLLWLELYDEAQAKRLQEYCDEKRLKLELMYHCAPAACAVFRRINH